ncbi:MAG: NADH-quinone oxidoreductase subunit NuoG [Anaerolineae bacterium]|jgi:NADH-quinone oxidoreductase subunit G
MATIYIEGNPYKVEDGQNLLQACLSLGFDLPYFCWHPALGSVGACRQCAVKQFKDEDDTQGKIVMACMTPANEGTRISIDDPEIRHFRASVIEWLMVNHPHDCPVCDEGGECHLQDMTVLTGHTYREFRFQKRTHRNQYLGPFVNHEMNRCIACYRCVRFYRGYAGGRDFDVFGAHNYVYFGRHEEGVLESEFSGNLVEVCPTGVFTDKTLKQHYTRKWDLQTAPSICVHCGLGCNTIPGERYGTLRRIRNRYNHHVNGYFLCDRGRYGYEFVNSQQRLRTALHRSSHYEKPRPIDKQDAIQRVAGFLAQPERVIGIGSSRASLEANFVLRALVGPENFHLGLSATESRLLARARQVLQAGPARLASLRDAARADAVLVLGEDVSNTAPRLALALRQAVRQQPMAIARRLKIPEWEDTAVREAIQDEKGPLYLAVPHGTRLDDLATRTYRAAPDDLARLGFAVAHALDHTAPAVGDLPDEVAALAQEIAEALGAAERPLIVSGTGCGSEALLQAAANVARALCNDERQASLCLAVPECNSLGLALLGGESLEAAFHAVQGGAVDTLVVLENDLYRRAGAKAIYDFFEIARHVVALDHLANRTVMQAEIALPAATFAESSGTLVNSEGRAQRFYQVFVPEDGVQASWRWLRDVMLTAGRSEAGRWQTLDDLISAMVEALPALEPVVDAAPPAGFRLIGQKVPRQPPRYTGRTAMHANVEISEPQPPDDPDSPLAFSMEGYEGQPPPVLIQRYWAPHWNSVQALNKFQQEIAGPLRGGDPGVRLIEPGDGSAGAYATKIPAAREPRAGQWLVVPLYHIFGSEELSVLTPGVLELAPEPYLALNPDDAAGLGVDAGDEVEFHVGERRYRLPLRLLPALPPGLAGLPSGLPEGPELAAPGQSLTISGESDRE